MSFGARLKELRKNKGLTQQELGDIIHVSKVSISGYERGERSPDRETLTALADYFNVTTDYLLGRIENPHSEKENKGTKKVDLSVDDVVFSFNGEEISKETMQTAIELIQAARKKKKR